MGTVTDFTSCSDCSGVGNWLSKVVSYRSRNPEVKHFKQQNMRLWSPAHVVCESVPQYWKKLKTMTYCNTRHILRTEIIREMFQVLRINMRSLETSTESKQVHIYNKTPDDALKTTVWLDESFYWRFLVWGALLFYWPLFTVHLAETTKVSAFRRW